VRRRPVCLKEVEEMYSPCVLVVESRKEFVEEEDA